MTARVSLVRRVAALAVVWAVLVLVAGGIALTALYRTTVVRDVDARLDDTLRVLLVSLQPIPDGRAELVRPAVEGVYDQALSGRYWSVGRIDRWGRLVEIARSRSLFDGDVAFDPGLRQRLEQSLGQVLAASGRGPADEPLRLRAQMVYLEGGDTAYVLMAAADRTPIDRDVRRFALAAAWMLGVFALALTAAVVVQIRWGLAPVFRMREAVAEVRSGERARMDGDAPAELAPLASELNALIDHNQALVERARAHVGNLAHALKTPIAVLLNESRTADGPLAELVRRQGEAMSRQVDHHLKRASAAARAQAVGARAEVAGVIEDIARTLPRMHPDRPVAIETRHAPDIVFRGERQDLEEMVGNLLENAFKWARSRVVVAAEIGADPARLSITVEDDGQGLPPEKREEMVRRGARLDEAAPGSGLGLSIVDDLARAYDGRLILAESGLGGLRAALDLPAATPRRVTRH
ncbi:MAG: sensor histidine kinase [Caulobacterales bacterium]|nr:sensor histidine kinase [Caulobacterales bacterium]